MNEKKIGRFRLERCARGVEEGQSGGGSGAENKGSSGGVE